MLVPTHGPNKADVPEVAGAKGEADELRTIAPCKGRRDPLQGPSALAGADLGQPEAVRFGTGEPRPVLRPAQGQSDGRRVDRMARDLGDRAAPVSYTHLTLPTKRIV